MNEYDEDGNGNVWMVEYLCTPVRTPSEFYSNMLCNLI